MKRRILATILAVTMTAVMLAGCGGNQSAQTNEPAAAEDTAQAPQAAEETETEAPQEAASGDSVLKEGKFVIGLSNSFYGNTWRKQMVESFTKAAEAAKAAGYISDYEIQNGDNTTNAQIAQINSFIMEGVDAICICAASSTALNSTIQKALDAGIIVISFDNVVDLDGVYKMDYPWEVFGQDTIEYIADRLDGKGNIILSHAVSGGSVDQGVYNAMMEALKAYPDIQVVQEIYGEADPTKTQEELTKVMASLPDIDAVTTVGAGDAIGVVNAFEQTTRELPIIIGDGSAEFINWWQAQEGYETLSEGITPAVGAAAFWTALDVLNGYDVPKNMMVTFPQVTADQLGDYQNMEAGSFVSPDFTNEYVLENIIDPAK